MGIFDNQIKFISEFQKQIPLIFEQTINSFDYVVKDFIVTKQLFNKGIDGRSKKLEGYKRTVIKVKIKKGQPTDRTTLHDTEAFVGSIEVKAFSDRFEISSNVSYDKYIIKKYGIDVLRPTNENMIFFINTYFIPNLKNK